jgi:ATP-binding cassette, subfamily G (WHITE), member 2
MSGKPVDVIVEEEEFGARLYVNIEGSPFPIEAVCNATACTLDPNPDFNETAVRAPAEYVWDERATFSLIILSILALIFILISLFVFIPEMMVQKGPVTYSGASIEHEEGTETKQVLEFRNITSIVTLRPDAAEVHGHKEKKILDNVSGKVESGTLTAIMGPTGSGKSTLLNVLAAVGNVQARVSGKILLNGAQPGAGYRHQVSYVQQDDTLYGTLTVRECVEYSAMLRLPKNMKVIAKQAYVSKTLEELRLTHIAQNHIGTGGRHAGVSGGERKRVSIGMELVSQPSVLVLDEPTSGLDSFAANKIVSVLSELSSRNRIVMVSIHQPSMKCFMMFDQVMVLANGQVMYRGHPGEVNEYLEILGFPCPSTDTAADHLLQVVSDKNNFAKLKKSEGDPENIEEQHASSKPAVDDEEEVKPLLNELKILFARTSKDIFRNKQLFLVQMAISIILAFFCGLIFRDVQDNLAGFQNRMGAFYFSLSFFAFASLSSMDIFVRERQIFVREVGSKYFRAFSYFLSKTVLDMFVLRVIPASIFSVIFYWMVGLRNSPEAFIKFWATMVLFNICAGVLSICIGVAAPTVGQANLIAAVWFLIMLLFGGFLLNVDSMEVWYAWLKYLSIFYYAFEILMTNELAGLLLSFDAPGYPEIPVYGEIFLLTIGMDVDNQLRDLICLCCFALGCMVAAYMLLLLLVPQCAGRQFQSMETENKRIK